MRGWSKLNPVNHLFGRIFFWFWGATVIIIFTTVWTVKQFGDQYELAPIKERDLIELGEVTERISRWSARAKMTFEPKAMISRISRQQRTPLMLYDVEAKEYIFGMPEPLVPDTTLFDQIVDEPRPYAIRAARVVFFGPSTVVLNGKEYKLFTSKPRHGSVAAQIRDRHPGLILGMALVISGALCFLLAWSLVKPIRRLQATARTMATGDLSARVDVGSGRRDELGELAADFNKMAEQVSALLESQKRLLADVSHELRSPLARLQLAIGIAQQDSDEHASQVVGRQLERIDKEANQIEDMLAKILTLSRLEANAQRPEMDDFDLVHCVARLTDDANFEAQQQGKSVRFAPSGEISLHGDQQLLASAVENVLRNAVRYASEVVSVEVEEKEGEVILSICDDGQGLPESELPHIFTPFYRVSASRNRKSGGVGLGLAIAMGAINVHRGTIEAKTNQPSGLCVLIALPKST